MRRRFVEVLWGVFAVANLVAMAKSPSWETIPFHFIWVSLTILYGFRVWGTRATGLVLGVVAITTGALILRDAFQGTQLWGELWEVPLMSAMFLAMVWHARRRQSSLKAMESLARERADLVERQEQLLHDVSHELRTPITIARGHLEVLRRGPAIAAPEVGVALDELDRMAHLVEQLLLLAKTEQPDFAVMSDIDIEPFIEDVFVRWSDVAPRAWRLGAVEPGVLHVDTHALRIALDALLENAVDHTTSADLIELAVRRSADSVVVIDVRDGGPGIPPEALHRIFERFGRAEHSRTRRQGGVGLGLAIVDAIARAHGGGCTVTSSPAGSTFSLRLSGFGPAAPAAPSPGEPLRLPRHRPPRMSAVGPVQLPDCDDEEALFLSARPSRHRRRRGGALGRVYGDDRMRRAGAEPATTEPEGDVHEADQHGHLDQRRAAADRAAYEAAAAAARRGGSADGPDRGLDV